ncbi:hypothetical protein A2Y83_03125 [Candidatus Falkowbacteria bacterium RBG_13_39_14]|uniref:DUF1902 domain-containing protein n=1 Tax=Candidatus Falkowbacteria bacterium RBG_13_39_14 TaxID=1797985 RepID=A0A1F5S7K4_9BACT|nr:MAG: hypothetical protein A2Y83_03125 [Candidatus Falkowbacteria bacterium RBG_13_39_14]
MFGKIYRYFYPHQNPLKIKEKYNIPSNIRLNIRLTKEGWLIASSPDLPGLVTEARNGKELLDMVNDAVLTYFDVPRKEADIVFNSINVEGHGSISYNEKYQTI